MSAAAELDHPSLDGAGGHAARRVFELEDDPPSRPRRTVAWRPALFSVLLLLFGLFAFSLGIYFWTSLGAGKVTCLVQRGW